MGLPDDVFRMMGERPAERLWLAIHDEVLEFDELMVRSGLRQIGQEWVELDAQSARRYLSEILHKDLAYGSELMMERTAERLAHVFVSAFNAPGARFATNAEEMWFGSGVIFEPATRFTMDTGVAVAGEAGSAVFWVADED